MASSLLKDIGDTLADFVDSVREQLADDAVRRSIAEDLGLQPGESVPKADLPQENLDGVARYRSQANPDKEAFVVLLNDVRSIYEGCRSFVAALGVGGTAVHNEMLHRLFDLLALNYVRLKSPSTYFASQAIAAMVDGTSELAVVAETDDESTMATVFDTLFKVVVFALSPAYYIFGAFGAKDEASARRTSDRIFPHLAAVLALTDITEEVIYGWDTFEDPAQLRTGLRDVAALALRLRDTGDPVAAYLRTKRETQTQQLLASYDGSGPVSATLRQHLTEEFEKHLRDADLYDEARFAEVTLSERTKKLARGQLQGDELIRLNLDLLRAAFPEAISRSSQPLADAISERALTVAFRKNGAPSESSTLGGSISTTLLTVPATHAHASGLLASIGGEGELAIDLSSKWRFLLAAVAQPAFSVFLDTSIRTLRAHGPTNAPLHVALVSIPDSSNVTYAIPDADGTRLEIGQLAFSFGFNGTSGEIKAQARRCALVLVVKDEDAFLAKFLPDDGLRVPFDFGFGFSTERRFFTEGGIQWPTGAGAGRPSPPSPPPPSALGTGEPSRAGPTALFAAGSATAASANGAGPVPTLSGTSRPELGMQQVIEIGRAMLGVRLNHLLLSLAPASDPAAAKATAEVSVSLAVKIGPVTAAVERIGFEFGLGFPKTGGNVGFADLSLGFKGPTGVGIAVDSAFVSGGGFLFLDREKGQYAGFLQLTIQETITVTAIGVITTRLPGGARGFSFVVMITAENFRPIPLGLGFTLTGIGGLLAINRTVNEEFLREGIKNKTLDHILFPKDPLRNAAQLFTTLNTAFPPRDGSHVFGPVVQIRWGSPPVLTLELGLVLELGNRRRLIILGRVSAILPSAKNDLLRLQMNALGVIDFDQNSISLDAVLYDSRLVGKFPITGGMALRLRWGSAPVFALSIGGFHPAFKPPAGFPVLQRLAISFSNTDSFRLRAEKYLALTSNTLQFGARLDMFAKAGGFSVEGGLGYDVLIQFDPFSFLADFYASLQLKRGSRNLFKVKLEGQLAGPRPLRVRGRATFEILWCDFTFSFDKTLVSGEAPPRPDPVLVMAQLRAALDDPRSWRGQLPAGERRLVSLREADGDGRLALHPLGTLSVKQNVVPLDLEIARFGNTTPADGRIFRIDGMAVNGADVPFQRVKDFFAPTQFLDLSDDEKLKAPSFEGMTAGVSAGQGGVLFPENDLDVLEEPTLRYETRIIDRANGDARDAEPFAVDPESLDRSLVLGAAARSDLRRSVAARYRPAESKNRILAKGWTVSSAADGTVQPAADLPAGAVTSYAESFQALETLRHREPGRAKELMLVRVAAPRPGAPDR